MRQTAPLELSLMEGSGTYGSANSTGAGASFKSITGVVLDSAGNLFVVDDDDHDHTVRKIAPAGMVTTCAGASGIEGSDNGVALTARFRFPYGSVIDSAGNLFVSDSVSLTVRKITPAGIVSPFAGKRLFGFEDETGKAAKFNGLLGLATNITHSINVADRLNSLIRKITPVGVVTTVAGTATTAGFNDATGTAAKFNYPWGVASDASGTMYVADTNNNNIRKITAAGAVATLAGSATDVAGYVDGASSVARFKQPIDLKVDSAVMSI